MFWQHPWFWPIVSALVTAVVAPITVQFFSHRINARVDAREMRAEEERKRELEEAREREAQRIEHERIMGEAMQAVLRNDIIAIHDKYGSVGVLPIHEKSALEHTYRSYHELGGDDVATSLYLQLMSFPTSSDDFMGQQSFVGFSSGDERHVEHRFTDSTLEDSFDKV